MPFTVLFYETASGSTPVEDFLERLPSRLRQKTTTFLGVLQREGPMLREPYTKSLGHGIYELRCALGSDAVRLLYFYYRDQIIIVTNGFVKKERKTPRRELKLAKDRKREIEERLEHENTR